MFESPLSREQVTARLGREIAAPEYRPFENRPQLFEGTFADGRFRMVRLSRGRNSLRPMISGELSSGVRGARVDVRLWLHPGVLAAFAIVFLVGGAAASIAVPDYLRSRQPSVPLGIAALIAWMFVGFTIGATVEARRATRLLARFFETEPAGHDRR